MTAREVMEWQAYEQVFGSLLIHERVDMGLAKVAFMLSDGKRKFREFWPEWLQELTAEDELRKGMAMLRGLSGVTSADD